MALVAVVVVVDDDGEELRDVGSMIISSPTFPRPETASEYGPMRPRDARFEPRFPLVRRNETFAQLQVQVSIRRNIQSTTELETPARILAHQAGHE